MFNLLIFLAFLCREQPPPRGCVLKLVQLNPTALEVAAAASARLCVETLQASNAQAIFLAAASARLCVETPNSLDSGNILVAAASARLCVETSGVLRELMMNLAAASARLCVETKRN